MQIIRESKFGGIVFAGYKPGHVNCLVHYYGKVDGTHGARLQITISTNVILLLWDVELHNSNPIEY